MNQTVSHADLRSGIDREQNWERVLFAALLMLHLLPIWLFHFVPTQDGPAHLYNASLLNHRNDGSILWQYFVINPRWVPNWLGHILLSTMMKFVPMLIAEKILLSGYLLLMPLGILYALRSINREAGWLAVLAFPFSYNFLFHLGFFNFGYGVALMIFVIGYWLRYQEHFDVHHGIGLGILILLLYFTHLLPMAIACLTIGLMEVWLTVREIGEFRAGRVSRADLWSHFFSRVIVPFIASLPALVLVVLFIIHKAPVIIGAGLSDVTIVSHQAGIEKVLWFLRRFTSFQRAEAWVWIVFIGILVFVFFRALATRLRKKVIFERWDGMLLVLPLLISLHLLSPKKSWGENLFLRNRLELIPSLLAILWFGTQLWGDRVRKVVQFLAAGVAVAMLVIHMNSYRILNDRLDEYLSVLPKVENNKTIVAYSFSESNPSTGRASWGLVNPFLHASSYVAAQRQLVDLANYEAKTDYFPIRFRKDVALDHADYTLLWCAQEDRAMQVDDNEKMIDLSEVLAGYEKIFTSPGGRATLYRSIARH